LRKVAPNSTFGKVRQNLFEELNQSFASILANSTFGKVRQNLFKELNQSFASILANNLS
jgi:hypothetical protein